MELPAWPIKIHRQCWLWCIDHAGPNTSITLVVTKVAGDCVDYHVSVMLITTYVTDRSWLFGRFDRVDLTIWWIQQCWFQLFSGFDHADYNYLVDSTMSINTIWWIWLYQSWYIDHVDHDASIWSITTFLVKDQLCRLLMREIRSMRSG